MRRVPSSVPPLNAARAKERCALAAVRRGLDPETVSDAPVHTAPQLDAQPAPPPKRQDRPGTERL